jgi:rubredoxin
MGDKSRDVIEGKKFEMLKDEWVCNECEEEKDKFI